MGSLRQKKITVVSGAAFKQRSRNAEARLELGRAEAEFEDENGRPEEGLRHYEAALKLAGTNTMLKAEILTSAASMCLESGARAQALAYSEALVKLMPDDDYALFMAGKASADMRKQKKAVGYFERAYAIEPDNFDIMLGFAEACFLTGREDDAVRLWQEFLATPPDPDPDPEMEPGVEAKIRADIEKKLAHLGFADRPVAAAAMPRSLNNVIEMPLSRPGLR